MKKLSKAISFLMAAAIAVSSMAVPVSAKWYKTQDGKYYYTDNDGDMCIGWCKINGEKYYFDDDGYMKTGWLKTSGGKEYYLRSDGKMAHDCTLKINGEIYSFDSNGVSNKGTTKKKVSLDFGLSLTDFKNSSNFSNYSPTKNDENVYVMPSKYAGEEGYFFLGFLNGKLFSKGYVFDYKVTKYLDLKDHLTDKYGESTYINGEYVWKSKSSDIQFFDNGTNIYIYFYPKNSIKLPSKSTDSGVKTDGNTVFINENSDSYKKPDSSKSESKTVYVTKTGKRYHYDSHCNGGKYYASTLGEALNRGLTPCNKCVN